MRINRILLPAILLLVAASLAGAARQSRDERDLTQLIKDRQAAMNRRDAAFFEKLLADDFVSVNGTGVMRSRAEWLADLRRGDTQLRTSAPERIRVKVYGDTAVVHCRVNSEGQVNGKAIKHPIYGSCVFVRRNGRWQCVAAHWTPVLP